MAYSYPVGDQADISQRSLAFVLVVSLHVLFFWVLASGLGAKIVQTIIPPSQTTFIDDVLPTDKPPPPVDLKQPLPVVIPPVIDLGPMLDVPSGPTITVTSGEPPVTQVAQPVQMPKPAVVRTAPSAMGKGARTPLPEYPPAMRRAGAAGTVTLRCYVNETGKCEDVSVLSSSGFGALDEAAVTEVRRNWRFVPAKDNGKPVAAWHSFAVTFRLTD